MPTGRVRGLTNPPPEVLRLERWLSPAVLAYSNRPDAHDLSSAPRGRVSFAEMENLRMGPRCAGSLGRFLACAFFTISLDMDRGPWLGAQVKMRATVLLRIFLEKAGTLPGAVCLPYIRRSNSPGMVTRLSASPLAWNR